jgi:ferrous iron transport protein B
LATAWVIAVMLPPMAIFFPLFTLLEDFGYLPRVAFNMDRMFQRVGAHGKQALTMCMGFGCNAAGVVATRVIDSPRERLVAIKLHTPQGYVAGILGGRAIARETRP